MSRSASCSLAAGMRTLADVFPSPTKYATFPAAARANVLAYGRQEDAPRKGDLAVAIMAIASFVSELIRAANEVDRLSMSERRRLLERAANVIRDCRGDTWWTDKRAKYPLSEIETQLRATARDIAVAGEDDVASLMLHAARAMNDLRVIADALRDGCSVPDDSLGGKYRALVSQRLSRIEDGAARPSLPEK